MRPFLRAYLLAALALGLLTLAMCITTVAGAATAPVLTPAQLAQFNAICTQFNEQGASAPLPISVADAAAACPGVNA